jgi:2-polyprenyl-6-hydroxyphenyl methylase/3-demethylubiquinone-9 3-methyltransferase
MTCSVQERYVFERFNTLESRFKAHVPLEDYRLEAIFRTLGSVAGLRILDLGCGKGRFTRRLHEAGAEVVGVDPARGMLQRGARLDRVQATARQLPFPTDSFDAVLAVEVFQHAQSLDEALREIARVLRPGGMVVIVDRNAASLNARRPWLPNLAVKWLDQRRGRWMYPLNAPVHERWFWPWALSHRLGRIFGRTTVSFLMGTEEASRAIFRRLPWTRTMALWTARAPGVAND